MEIILISKILAYVLQGITVYRRMRDEYNTAHPEKPLPLPDDATLIAAFGEDVDALNARIADLQARWRA